MVKPVEEKIKTRTRKIPAKYIREVVNGKPYYYKGYKSVMNGTKQIEEIMGSSSLQSFLVAFISGILFSKINRKKYSLTTNETGLHLGTKNNLATDIGIFLKEKVVLNDKYFEIAPEIAIEVDVKIETDKDLDYVFSKSDEMMNFGTERILWVLTKHKKIFVFSKNETTQILDWNKDVVVMEGVVLNLHDLLEEEDVNHLLA
ncbi:Uma2 family endonuclease [Emticicia sp. W12TSBA100-4]|uniref:Uma2 family endonuclease n=1 Tax=Emticicia sp. W12TSBA100-4 TaxID=3160965 RepID=UPI00330673E9